MFFRLSLRLTRAGFQFPARRRGPGGGRAADAEWIGKCGVGKACGIDWVVGATALRAEGVAPSELPVPWHVSGSRPRYAISLMRAWADGQNRRPRAATKSLRKRDAGLGNGAHYYRSECYLFSTHRFAPCFLTFVRRGHSETFEGGLGAPRFFASEWVICTRINRVMLERDTGA